MLLYGLEIPDESAFWDEVKLRSMNNYGEWEDDNIDLAIEEVFDDIASALKRSKEAIQLKKEIQEEQT